MEFLGSHSSDIHVDVEALGDLSSIIRPFLYSNKKNVFEKCAVMVSEYPFFPKEFEQRNIIQLKHQAGERLRQRLTH